MDTSVYFICKIIRMHTFMQWGLQVESGERKDNVLSLSLSLSRMKKK